MKPTFLVVLLPLIGCQQPVTAVSSAQTTSKPVAKPALNASPAEPWKLSVSDGADGTYRIHVADTQTKEIQVLEGPEAEAPFDAAELLKLEDYTGDGKPDILARGLSVGVSALRSEVIYPYDATTGRFNQAQIFEHDGEVSKTTPGCIAVEYRNGDNMTYTKDVYCWHGRWLFEGSD